MQRIQGEELKGLSEAAIATLQTSLGIEVKTIRIILIAFQIHREQSCSLTYTSGRAEDSLILLIP